MDITPEGKLKCTFRLRREVVHKLKAASALYPDMDINAAIEVAGLIIVDALERERLPQLLDDYNGFSAQARKLQIPIFNHQEIHFFSKKIDPK